MDLELTWETGGRDRRQPWYRAGGGQGARGRGRGRRAAGAGQGGPRGGAGDGRRRGRRRAGARGQLPTPATTTSVRRMAVRAVAEGLGGVDILVNAAARPNTGAVTGIEKFDAADFSEQVNIKVMGYLRCARQVAPLMIAQGWGRIINVSGLAARGQSGSVVGSIRNVSVAAMTKNLADELGPHGINVTVVHPGVTVTETHPADPRAASRTRRGVSAGNRAQDRRLHRYRAARHRRGGGGGRRVPRLAEEGRAQRRRDHRERRQRRADLLLTPLACQDRVTGAGGPGRRSGCGLSGPGRRRRGARRSCQHRPPPRRGSFPRWRRGRPSRPPPCTG